MANDNCLEGMRCPQCGSDEPFRIAVTQTVLMYDAGSEDDAMGGDMDWDESSSCECQACHHAGTVAHFRVPAPRGAEEGEHDPADE